MAFLKSNRVALVPNWPSRSPDLNPMDFSIWGILEAKLGDTVFDSDASLKARLIQEFQRLPEGLPRKVIDGFRRRIDICIENDGASVEINKF